MSGSQFKKILLSLFVLICYYTQVFSIEKGDLIWKSCTGWGVHSIVPTGDIDGDWISDLFVGSGDDVILCFSGAGPSGSNRIWSFPVGSDVWTVTNLEDVNGDGINDCLAGSGDDMIYCVSGRPLSGETYVIWSRKTGGDVWSVASINDLNGDGINDCIAGTGTDSVYCLSGVNGEKIWSYKDSKVGAMKTVASIADLDGNGKDECLAGGENDKVVCISSKGKVIWYYLTKSTVLSVAAIEDVTGDGYVDCLIGGEDDYVYCISGKSSGKANYYWRKKTGSTIKSVSQIADANGDNVPDCLVGGQDDKIYCLSGKNGNIIWYYKTKSTVLSVKTIPDVNGNGGEDCIAGGEDNYVYCIDGKSSGTGVVYWRSKIIGSVTCVAGITDLNGNGAIDVISGSDDSYVYVFEGGETIVETITAPDLVSGPSNAKVGQSLDFNVGGSTSNLGHPVEYQFGWGNGTMTGWGPSSRSKIYQNAGVYYITTQARCLINKDIRSRWSPKFQITISGHNLNVSDIGLGSVTKSTEKSEYNHNENVTLTAVPASGYKFDNWGGDLSGDNNPASLIMDNNKNITAYFSQVSVTVSPPSKPNGPSSGKVGQSLSFSTGNSKSNYEPTIEYCFNWGDGNISVWGDSSRSYDWSSEGAYIIKARARCETDTSVVSDWSEGLTVTIHSSSGVNRLETAEIPSDFRLFQNYPNPFNSGTCITFHLPQQCDLKFEIFNINGKLISTPADGFYTAGVYQFKWDGKMPSGNSAPSGLYVYRLRADKFNSTKLMMLLK